MALHLVGQSDYGASICNTLTVKRGQAALEKRMENEGGDF